VRVAPWLMVLACMGLGFGCSSLTKKNSEAPRPGSAPATGAPSGKAPAQFPSGGDPLFQSGVTPKSPTFKGDLIPKGEVGGILAGTIRDPYNQPAREAYIRYVCLDEAKQEEAPIDVAVDGQGDFRIQGLQPHKKYKLIARAKQGEKLVAAVHYATTPDIHVYMRLKEDFVNSSIPDVPPSPAYTPKKAEPKKEEPKKEEKKEDPKTALLPPAPQAGWNTAIKSPAGAQLGLPRPEAAPSPPTPPAPPPSDPSSTGWVPGIAQSPKSWPPTMEVPKTEAPKTSPIRIQTPTPLPDPPPGTAPSLPKAGDAAASTQTRVPTCVLLGRHLKNLALYDTAGQVWEYQTQRRGKLVLLDFWGTWCPPCVQSVPHLQAIQIRYPAVEVIGIAYEHGGARQEQVNRVNAMCQRLKTSYRQLLGSGQGCPVQSQFDVRAYPTMVLLDENGEIIWRHEGLLDSTTREDLELLIQRRLGMR